MREALGFAIEGGCLMGKSEALRTLSICSTRLYVVPEYFEIGTLSCTSRRDLVDVRRIQDEIVTLEKRRTELALSTKEHFSDSEIGFDRSYLSCLAYEATIGSYGYLSGLTYLAERLCDEVERGNVVLPGRIVHLTGSEETFSDRRRNHLAKGHRDLPAFLLDPKVRQLQDEFIRSSAKNIYGRAYSSVSTDSRSLRQVALAVLTRLDIMPSCPSPRMDIMFKYEQT